MTNPTLIYGPTPEEISICAYNENLRVANLEYRRAMRLMMDRFLYLVTENLAQWIKENRSEPPSR